MSGGDGDDGDGSGGGGGGGCDENWRLSVRVSVCMSEFALLLFLSSFKSMLAYIRTATTTESINTLGAIISVAQWCRRSRSGDTISSSE